MAATTENLVAGYMRNNFLQELNDNYPLPLNEIIAKLLGDVLLGIGDQVMLDSGKIGIIRHIGSLLLPNIAEQEVIGIKLDYKIPSGGNGSIDGQQLFETEPGKGYFTTYKYFTKIIMNTTLTAGTYARLTKLVRVPKFNNKVVKVIAYVEKKGRWKVKIPWGRSKKYLGVREENLAPIAEYWHLVTDSNQYENSDMAIAPVWNLIPKVGDRVRTKDGKYGIVEYIGPFIEFDADTETSYIGLKLEQWDINAHNGSVQGKRYFESDPGYGWFIGLRDMVENCSLQTAIQLKKESGCVLNDFPNIGDCVVTDEGQIGVVKYIGTISAATGLYIGLELNRHDENAGNGTIVDQKGNIQRYFYCWNGRGNFVRLSNLIDNFGVVKPIWY